MKPIRKLASKTFSPEPDWYIKSAKVIFTQKENAAEREKLKNTGQERPHFLATNVKFELKTNGLPGLEDMRGITDEMDAGAKQFFFL